VPLGLFQQVQDSVSDDALTQFVQLRDMASDLHHRVTQVLMGNLHDDPLPPLTSIDYLLRRRRVWSDDDRGAGMGVRPAQEGRL